MTKDEIIDTASEMMQILEKNTNGHWSDIKSVLTVITGSILDQLPYPVAALYLVNMADAVNTQHPEHQP